MRYYIFAQNAAPGTQHIMSGDLVGSLDNLQITLNVPAGANQPAVGTAYKISSSASMAASSGVSTVTCITAATPNYTFQ